jgi:2-methylcitrate dehydratase PrpD
MLSTYFKPYPACRHLHGPIEAALRLRQDVELRASDVAEIVVSTYEVASRHNERTPTSVLGAQMSIPFAVATALVSGRVGLSEFSLTSLTDPEVNRLAKRVSVTVGADAQRSYPAARPATVRVTRTDRSTVSHTVEQPYGEPANPLTDEDLAQKFHGLVDGVIGAEGARRLLDQTWAMDDLGFIRLAGELALRARESRIPSVSQHDPGNT